MNGKDIWILYTRELRSALRERAVVVNSILIPALLYPVLMWLVYTGITFVSGQNEGLHSRVALVGLSTKHQAFRADLERAKDIDLVDANAADSDLRAGRLDAILGFGPEPNLEARITYDESLDRSTIARDRLSAAVREYRERFLKRSASNIGITPAQYQVFAIDELNVSTGVERGRFLLGLVLPLIFVIMLTVGGLHPAIDATAGERENSTWETLMTAATSRSNIVASKYLYVATMSFVAGALNVTAMMVSMKSILAPAGTAAAEMSFQIPWAAFPILFLGASLLALFLSAGMMILASFARTFKEGQSMVSPFYVAMVAPMMLLPGSAQQFTLGVAMIPVVNVTVMFRDALVGSYNWKLIGVTIMVEALAVAFALRLSAEILKHEDFVMGSYGGSFGKFLKQRFLK